MNFAPTPVISGQNREESETYARVVAALNPKLRVIRGKCNLCWLLQVRKSPTRFETIAYCATKTGLFLRIKEHLQPRDAKRILQVAEIAKFCAPEAWAAIDALPDYYPK